MRTHIRRLALAAVVFVAGLQRTDASFHLMLIDEIYPGSFAHPDAQYVVLRSTFVGQNFLPGHPIKTFDAQGNPGPDFGIFTFPIPENADNGARYLMATPEAVALFGIAATQVVTGRLPFPSGRICFDSAFVDCVAYGDFTGNNGIYLGPAAALVRQRALKRTQDIDNNALSFALGPPGPFNDLNESSPDGDGDGIPDFSDCAPGDGSLYLAPLEVRNLVVERTGLTTISWDDQTLLVGSPTSYDLVTHDLTGPGTPAPFAGSVCGAPDLATPTATDPDPDPPPGGLRLYLSRATNGCGNGTFGDGSPAPDPRDTLDDPFIGPCS